MRRRRAGAAGLLLGVLALVTALAVGTGLHDRVAAALLAVASVEPSVAGQLLGPGPAPSRPPAEPARPTTPAPVEPFPGGFTKVAFYDDFAGDRLNTRRWLPSRDGHRSGAYNTRTEGAYFDPANVSVSDGRLDLRLEDAPGTEVWGKTYQWSSGAVSTEGKFSLGDDSFLEARIKIPTSDGLWPSFWTMVPGPRPPEIDVFEYFGTQKQTRPKFNYHPTTGPHTGPERYGDPAVDYRQGWHTYGVLRKDGVLTPYVDGVAYPEAAVTGADDRQHHILLNLSAYAGYDPEPGSTMSVDWVRVRTA